jgi:RNA-directed DNA polymerase
VAGTLSERPEAVADDEWMEKSDLPEVARKRTNKAASAAAEPVERRGGAKENADLQSTVRTQSREAVSQAQARIREAVIRNGQDDELTALLHHINIEVLRTSFFGLKKTAAPGVDEMTWIGRRCGSTFQRLMADSGRLASPHRGQNSPGCGGGNPDADL